MTEVIVSLQNVTLRYPDQSSFSNINFSVEQGKHVALVGDNEPLKSALLDALAGKVNIINGKKTFHLNDKIIARNSRFLSDPAPQKLIAYVASRHQFRNLSGMQDFYYQQRFNSIDSENSDTVLEYLKNVEHFGTDHSWTLDNTIKRLNLYHLLDEGLIKLSNGETRRVLIAAALLRNPVLLLLQNPLAGLDEQSRMDIKELINQVAESGVTIVLSVPVLDIPAAITNIAIVKNSNNIITIPKSQYKAAVDEMLEDIEIDEQEVIDLISVKPFTKFEHIVLMKGIFIRYDDKVILDNINWTIKQGERWALLGPNGAGKSTLLSLINGDNPQAFANDIMLFDRKKGSGESIWDIKRNIGFFSPELYQYFPMDTTCLQAVESGFYDTIGLFRPSNEKFALIARRWMNLLGVDPLAQRLLRNVSSINQRLCLLARALVKNPSLLILDEPCQGFDQQQTLQFKKLLNIICSNSNVSLIYVSHYSDDIPESVTKVLKLDKGKQVETR